MSAMRIAVTGARGFVGTALCRRLLEEGNAVVAVTRGGEAPTGTIAGRIGSLDDAAGLAEAFRGADAIVHLAARVHVMSERAADPVAEFQRVNVSGTRAVMSAAAAASVRHVVFMSSVKVNGEGRDTPYTEADVPRPVDPYGQSKLDAEGVVRGASGTNWTIIRSPLVYGPGVGGNFRRLLKLARVAGRWPLPLGGIDNLRSMIFVDNLAAAISTAISHPMARHQTFLVSDDHDVGVSELLRRLAIDLGGRPRLFRAPMDVVRQAGALLGRTADIERMFGTLRVNSSLIQSRTGWCPPVELAKALGVTARWWRGAAPA